MPMPGGFAPRFVLEAAFLVLLGVGSGIADLRPIVIVAVLAGGWLLVSLIELAVWRAQSRTVASYLPPPQPPAAEPRAEPEPEPAPAELPQLPVAYPLRPDAGAEPSEEVEAYTRVIDGGGDDRPDEERA
jgi:hypothetical protein